MIDGLVIMAGSAGIVLLIGYVGVKISKEITGNLKWKKKPQKEWSCTGTH